MNNFSLAKMTPLQGAKGTFKLFPVISDRPSTRVAYLAEIRRLLKEIHSHVRSEIIPSYRTEITRDANENDFERLKSFVNSLIGSTTGVVARLVALDATKHTEQFTASARSAFSVDLRGLIETEDLRTYVDRAALRNAGLIKGLTDDLVKRIQFTTVNALVAGLTAGQLQKRLTEDFNFAQNRAKLIAADQTSKLNAELNKIRHQQAGVNEYIWRTSADERVRLRHKNINGKRYKYDELTGAENGAAPGIPVRCRCIAQGVVSFGEEKAAPAAAAPAPAAAAPAPAPAPTPAPTPAAAFVSKPLPEPPAVNKTASFIKSNDIAEQGSSLKDFEADGVVEMLSTQHVLNQRFNMKKLSGWGENGWAARKVRGAKKTSALSPAWFGMRSNFMAFNPIASSRSSLRELAKISNDNVKRRLDKRLVSVREIKDADLRKKALDFSENFRFHSLPTTPSTIVAHENGHRFHANFFKEVEAATEGWDEGWQHLMSEYGSTNKLEYVAESFAVYTTEPTQHWRIKPSLLKVFESKDLSK